MYQSKHEQPAARVSDAAKRKALVLLSVVAVLAVLFVGTTAALLVSTSGPVTNTFKPADIGCSVSEVFENNVKRDVGIVNTGDTEVYIRAAIVVTWQDGNTSQPSVYGKMPTTADYTMELNLDDWFQDSDGFYYCRTPVAAHQSTPVLIEECTANQNTTPAGYGLHVEILGSAIQSVPAEAVHELWKVVSVNSDGNLEPAGPTSSTGN